MRLSTTSRQLIRQAITEFVGEQASVKLFGSRLDDQQKGGDIDLLVTVLHPVDNPAMLVARLGAALHRALDGRKVDIVLQAPNLQRQPIHQIAEAEGIEL